MSTGNRKVNSPPNPGCARNPLTGYSGSTPDQLTLITRILEGTERTPGIIVHDYATRGEPGETENAILIYNIASPRSAVTHWEQKEVRALPLYDGTVWSITVQTFKVARQAAAKQAAQEEELARLQAELDAARSRIAELEEGSPR
jgi:hypothetical protein